MTNKIYYNRFVFILVGLLTVLSSCKKYVEIGTPPNQVSSSTVFTSDASATGAVLALYSYYYTYATSGTAINNSTIVAVNNFGGMASDDYYDLLGYYDEFKNNVVPVTDNYNAALWSYAYSLIYETNAIIEGLQASTGVTAATKAQLLGEAKFFRAFAYFYLVNFYGDIPLVTSTDVNTNVSMARTAKATVYKQIIADLLDAQTQLTPAYPSVMETRVNKWAATALLARAYLYTGDWIDAEAQASQVIGSGTYKLEPNPANVFINTSKETILQLSTLNGYTWFGKYLIPASTTPEFVLYPSTANAFETGDLRKTNWTKSIVSGTQTYYYPYKYKLTTATAGNEYVVLQRLAEQYLIRAEARAQQNNLTGAIADADTIRVRASLPVLSNTLNQANVLLAIEQERKVELFSEMGHRWLDLNRTGRATAVLGPLKPTWTSTAALFPIPLVQMQLNSNLTQNPGY